MGKTKAKKFIWSPKARVHIGEEKRARRKRKKRKKEEEKKKSKIKVCLS